jgi:hypothetical protein
VYGEEVLPLARKIATDGDPWLAEVLAGLIGSPSKKYSNAKHRLDKWHLLVKNLIESVGIVPDELDVLWQMRRWLWMVAVYVEWEDDARESLRQLKEWVRQATSRSACYVDFVRGLEEKLPKFCFFAVRLVPGIDHTSGNESEHLHAIDDGCNRDTPACTTMFKFSLRSEKRSMRADIDIERTKQRTLTSAAAVDSIHRELSKVVSFNVSCCLPCCPYFRPWLRCG